MVHIATVWVGSLILLSCSKAQRVRHEEVDYWMALKLLLSTPSLTDSTVTSSADTCEELRVTDHLRQNSAVCLFVFTIIINIMYAWAKFTSFEIYSWVYYRTMLRSNKGAWENLCICILIWKQTCLPSFSIAVRENLVHKHVISKQRVISLHILWRDMGCS